MLTHPAAICALPTSGLKLSGWLRLMCMFAACHMSYVVMHLFVSQSLLGVSPACVHALIWGHHMASTQAELGCCHPPAAASAAGSTCCCSTVLSLNAIQPQKFTNMSICCRSYASVWCHSSVTVYTQFTAHRWIRTVTVMLCTSASSESMQAPEH